ncbi:component of SufBCD complex [Yoonia maritima]|uniref:component of SufBCD complex n=1 Tax=Yoonia maritima TaxID=1435347 RepID=UPI000D107D4B|nr:component of SufBCD complex [Yoonia maritima]
MDFYLSQVWASFVCNANVTQNELDQQDTTLDWNGLFSRVLDVHTFSNLWYWIMVCTCWMIVSHWIIGVPFDMILRARRFGAQAGSDLEALVDINVRRIQALVQEGGGLAVGLLAFILTSVVVSALYYRLEVAQGVMLLVLPITFVGGINVFASKRLSQNPLQGAELSKYLIRLRLIIQLIAMVSVFISAAYGMLFSLMQPFGY